jgi:sulfhydrogenase subunit delta
MPCAPKPSVAVYKFSSCDGCQLSLLNLEDELLGLAGQVQFAYFLEATRSVLPGPYDIALVEGSITTLEEVERIQEVRRQAGKLVALGTCATSGGIQALRNLAGLLPLANSVYPHPEWLTSLEKVAPISAHVHVDVELWGCPISKLQLVELLRALIECRRPNLSRTGVCMECKRRGQVCVLVAEGIPCLGPVTQAGCGALCPGFGRGCYGCFGPLPTANPGSMAELLRVAERQPGEVERLLQHVNSQAPGFQKVWERAQVGPEGHS